MNDSTKNPGKRLSLEDAAKRQVAKYLYEVYSHDSGLLGDLDRQTQQRVTAENMAKLELVFDAEDAAEACYSDLIRELDAEAQSGIFLARPDSPRQHLRQVCDEPGVSGQLWDAIDTVAPLLFAEEAVEEDDNHALVWVTIFARHDRAHVDATISEIIMSHVLDNAAAARDMSNAIRSLQYSFHENIVRSRCDLPRLLRDRDMRDLMVMVAELTRRSGHYEKRKAAIRDKAELN